MAQINPVWNSLQPLQATEYQQCMSMGQLQVSSGLGQFALQSDGDINVEGNVVVTGTITDGSEENPGTIGFGTSEVEVDATTHSDLKTFTINAQSTVIGGSIILSNTGNLATDITDGTGLPYSSEPLTSAAGYTKGMLYISTLIDADGHGYQSLSIVQ